MAAENNSAYQRSTYKFEAVYGIFGEGDKRVYHATFTDSSGTYLPKTFQTSANRGSGRHQCLEMWPNSSERCPASYATSVLLQDHVKLFHQREPFLCKVCPKILADRSGAETHAKTHKGGTRYKCPRCDYKAQRRDNVVRHINSQHRAEEGGAKPIDLKTLGDNITPKTGKRRRQDDDDESSSSSRISGGGHDTHSAPMVITPTTTLITNPISDTGSNNVVLTTPCNGQSQGRVDPYAHWDDCLMDGMYLWLEWPQQDLCNVETGCWESEMAEPDLDWVYQWLERPQQGLYNVKTGCWESEMSEPDLDGIYLWLERPQQGLYNVETGCWESGMAEPDSDTLMTG